MINPCCISVVSYGVSDLTDAKNEVGDFFEIRTRSLKDKIISKDTDDNHKFKYEAQFTIIMTTLDFNFRLVKLSGSFPDGWALWQAKP